MKSPVDDLVTFAMAEHRAGRRQQAEALYREALKNDPRNPSANNLLGALLMERGDNKHAFLHLKKAAHASPGYEAAQTNFGSILYTLSVKGEAKLARDEAKAWAKRQPKNAIALHWAAALGAGAKAQTAMPEALVRSAFDGFAKDFDAKLKNLGYRVPELIAAALAPHVKPPLDILDAGCGTGLMALHLKPWARSLAGVDLSPAMIEQAKERGLYADLQAGELVAYLLRHPASFDLITAADVFCYLGDLEDVLSSAFASLRGNGLLAFTVEASDDGGFSLGQSGRYAHGEDYVRQALDAAGFGLLSLARDIARQEDGKPVACLVVTVIRRP